MNAKLKLLLGGLALIAVVGGSMALYKTLSKQYVPETILETGAAQRPTDGEMAGESAGESETTSPTEPEKKMAPDFSVVDGEGNTVKLSDFIGKPVVVNFWASWCPPCKEEMPDFEKVFKEMGEDVEFMMINATDGARETEKIAKKYITDHGFSFPVYYDTTQEASYIYGIASLPTTLFIDKDGHLIAGSKGMLSEEKLRTGIEMIQPEK